MLLSQFKRKTVRKVSFVEGEIKAQENETVLNGDIEFYELGKEKVKEIVEKLETKGKSDESIIFDLIPFLSDVVVDVTMDEFKEMLNEPSKEFAYFLSVIVSIIKDLFELVGEVAKMQGNAQVITSNITKLAESETIVEDAVIETNEEKLERLYEELTLARDNKEKRSEILNEIMVLQSEMEE